ncbi:MAG: winged helix-turn-helix transcriptional regulator [Candidatus Eisenbacteria bacterium]|nr:winged helix-turn-helix transcriptional regulator [Candidatus Eisenbacteria bacterium]MCC7140604.1 winged helix-turn-helix transcriptional regulator [Candidatus Eisenbacteria bacterium]
MLAELDRTLAALADPTRRAVVDLLRRGPRRPSEVAATLHTSRPMMSRHLGVLRAAGLVEQAFIDEDARGRLIRLRPEPLAELRGWIAEVEAFWGDQLTSFKLHAESKPRRRVRGR